MFKCAVASLFAAVFTALAGFGGILEGAASHVAQHLFLVSTGLFALTALAEILEIHPFQIRSALPPALPWHPAPPPDHADASIG